MCAQASTRAVWLLALTQLLPCAHTSWAQASVAAAHPVPPVARRLLGSSDNARPTSLHAADLSELPPAITCADTRVRALGPLEQGPVCNAPFELPEEPVPAQQVPTIATTMTANGDLHVAPAETFDISSTAVTVSALLKGTPGGLASSQAAGAAARLPTLFHPVAQGHKFDVTSADGRNGTILFIKDVALMVPDVPFANLSASRLMNHMRTDQHSRWCIANSMVFMRSCEGWDREPQMMLCCQKINCQTHNAEEVRQFQIPVGDLSPIPCFGAEPGPPAAPAPGGLTRAEAIKVGVIPVAAVVLLAALAGAAMHWRYRRALRAAHPSGGDFDGAAALARSIASIPSVQAKHAGSGRKSGVRSPERAGGAEEGRSSGGSPSAAATPFESARDASAPAARERGIGGHRGSAERRWDIEIHNNGDAQPYTASPRSVHTSASQAVDSEVLPDTFAEAKPARRVATALENMALADPPPPLAGGFVLVNERVVGGQAIVNFARGDRVGTYDQYAVKFFLQKKDFEREVRLYKDAELRRAMPRLFAAVANRGGEWRSRGGLVLPPHIVLERGVTLRDWSREARKYGELLNLFEQVAELLDVLHTAGRVHRDLKPQNVIYTVNSTNWRLLDFGIAARVGEVAFPGCTPVYAAPEVLRALEAGSMIAVDPAHDMWSLGVVMYEAIANASIAGRRARAADAYARAAGRMPYPWEVREARLAVPWRRSRLRAVAEGCLARDPAARLSARGVIDALRSMGNSTAWRELTARSGASGVPGAARMWAEVDGGAEIRR